MYLLEVIQHDVKSYVGFFPARELVKLATKAELQEPQEAQRPINQKRLEEISDFVADKGILSTSIVIGTKDDRLSVKPVSDKIPYLYKIEFPESENEFDDYKDSFDIMDGQHRLFSFLPEYIKISDSVPFDIPFVVYIKPTLKERRIIFKNTNEKQESVASNLLMWFREKLNMLSGKEKTYHSVVSSLSCEARSPLKGRIIMGAEKITGGFKAQQVITILDKADIKDVDKKPLDNDQMFKLITNYLLGWEKAVGSKFCDRDKTFGAFSKISGFRFMISMLPEFYNQAKTDKRKIDCSYVVEKLEELFATYGMVASDLFVKDSQYMTKLGSNPFSAETPTTLLAKEWINNLKALKGGEFDPLA